MEKELKALEDQIIEIRNNTSEQVTEEKRHIESLHSHEQVLKSKVRHIQNMSTVSMSLFDKGLATYSVFFLKTVDTALIDITEKAGIFIVVI